MSLSTENVSYSAPVKLKIHYRNEEIRKLYEVAGVQTSGSAGFDLVLAEDVVSSESRIIMADLGVVIKVPVGYHTILMPRSSTFKKYGIQQGNSIGLIDNDYCGKDDYLGFCIYDTFYHTRELSIPKGTRICQLMILPTITIDTVEEFNPEDESRGGWG